MFYIALQINDSDWPAINRNIKRARIAWGRVGKILSTEKASMKVMASVYRAIVVQAVLLYGAESWRIQMDDGHVRPANKY
jgi:hypothetical protein